MSEPYVNCNRVDQEFRVLFWVTAIHPMGDEFNREFDDLTKAHEAFRLLVQDILWNDYDDRYVTLTNNCGHQLAIFQKAHP